MEQNSNNLKITYFALGLLTLFSVKFYITDRGDVEINLNKNINPVIYDTVYVKILDTLINREDVKIHTRTDNITTPSVVENRLENDNSNHYRQLMKRVNYDYKSRQPYNNEALKNKIK